MYKEGGGLNHAICWGFLTNTSSAGDVKVNGDQHLSHLKMGSKILEQKVSVLPVDVELL